MRPFADASRVDGLEARRAELLSAIIPLAAFDGWTPAVMRQAERDAGAPAGACDLAFPGGVVEAIDAWSSACDGAAEPAYETAQAEVARVRERVTTCVRARIAVIGDDNREACRRALARLAFPDAAGRGVRLTWRAADRIWRGLGDASTDGAFYSKRAILSGVLASTIATWANADDDARVWEHLDRRIANVMEFEKAKARIKTVLPASNGPLAALARLRYAARRR